MEQKSWFAKNRAWFLSVLIPAAICFAAGASVGYWLIDKDAGRWLRDTGKVTPDATYIQSALYIGFIFASAGGLLGAVGRCIVVLGRKLLQQQNNS